MEPIQYAGKLYWQNLLDRRCPKCGDRLETIRVGRSIVIECAAEPTKCQWWMTSKNFVRILTDPSHPFHLHLSDAEAKWVDRLLTEIYAQ